MKKQFLVAIILALVFTNSDCKKNPVMPIDNTKPGSRDYTWVVDTIDIGSEHSLTLTRMWGSSPNDVWAVGYGDVSWNLIWHYDGNIWKKDSLQRQIAPWGVFGFGANNVWIVNSGGSIWKYDGSEWSFYTQMISNGYQRLNFLNISGFSANSVYAVGFADLPIEGNSYKGIISHYDGNNWVLLNIPPTEISFTNIKFQNENTGLISGNVYLQNQQVTKLFLFKNGALSNELYEGQTGAVLFNMGGLVYVGIGKVLYRLESNALTKINDFLLEDISALIMGRSEKDIFAFNQNGILHFNGNDWKLLYKTDWELNSYFCFSNDIYFIYQNPVTPSLHVMLHGTLR